MKHKTVIKTLALSLLCTLSLFADRGEDVYNKICSKCHVLYIPEDKLVQNFMEGNNTLLKLKAPTISQIAYSMKQKIGDPSSDLDIQRMEVSAFIADYIIYPDKHKSVLHPNVGKHFETMPSLKGKISIEDIEAISNFVYDFDPSDYKKRDATDVPFDTILQAARKENKIIIIEAIAPHCRYCEKMQKDVLVDPDVTQLLEKAFITVSVDLSKEELPMDLRVSMTPTFFFIFVDDRKDKVKIKRIPGAWNKEDFLDILKESILAKKNMK
jgi:thioredoxin-related protein